MKKCILLLFFLSRLSLAEPTTVSQVPLFLTHAVQPALLFNIPKDSQLFNRFYDDYSDLNEDGFIDSSYRHDFDYLGYFDPYKCYGYQDDHFYPLAFVNDERYCNSSWSGNFLNWASMTRIDIMRKLIYGGLRSDESISNTLLERSYLPPDGHSFAKFYPGSDLNKLTPFNFSEGITLCNLTQSNSITRSQNSTDPPLIRVAKGNYSLWAANERFQCQWIEERHDLISAFMFNQGSNGHQALQSGFMVSNENPSRLSLSPNSFQLKVSVCVAGFIDSQNNTEHCKLYDSGFYKPTGLIQKYADLIHFGLLSGSYQKSKSGGVLRKNIGSIQDEIDSYNGQFIKTLPTGSIIDSIDKLKIYGLDLQTGLYFDTPNTAACPWGLESFTEGTCQNSGNPQAEIFLESLRYLSGMSPNPEFNTNDESLIEGLKTSDWNDPVPADQWCRNLNVMQFNSGANSFDSDQLSNATEIGLSDLNSQTDLIGKTESISGIKAFIGNNHQFNEDSCTAKNIDALSAALGICPSSPGLKGSYSLAGLTQFSRNNDIRSDRQNVQTVNFYGIDLALQAPSISIPGGNFVLIPACRNQDNAKNCTLMDFKILSQDAQSGKFYIVWEDSEQGGDFDSDLTGILSYRIIGNKLTVTTQIIAYSSNYRLGFGYVISGSDQNGLHIHSGINNFSYKDVSGVSACIVCQYNDPASQWTFNQGDSPAIFLKSPLFYASKFNNNQNNYFDATHLSKLDTALDNGFQTATKTYASSTSIASSSSTLSTDTIIYQARFNSFDWAGQLLAYKLDKLGNISENPIWDASDKIPSFPKRKIFSYNDSTHMGIKLNWAELSSTQRKIIDKQNANISVSPLLNYISGDQSNEIKQKGSYRDRNNLLGDIVHSDPIFVGIEDYGYAFLKGAEGSDYAEKYRASPDYLNRKKMVYVGANDGMLHGFDASTGIESFAYLPSYLFEDLAKLTRPDYGSETNPHHYYVDGSLKSGDVYIKTANKSEWKTVLIGTTGAGGAGLFALDITNPESFDATKVLWEFSQDNDLGYSLPIPSIARMANGQWAAIIANGYESPNHKAVLFIIDIASGKIIKKIDTGIGSSTQPNGLSSPIVVDTNNDQIVDWIYAGDLQGNLWKFDVRCLDDHCENSDHRWNQVHFKDDKALFTAKDSQNRTQPITAKPQVSFFSTGNSSLLVYFGTGQYFATNDSLIDANPVTQSFYALLDEGSSPVEKENLTQQSIIKETTLGKSIVRISSNQDSSHSKGWYMDLPTPGERIIHQAVLRSGRIIFNTLIPSTEACSFGGSSWLMELNAFTGGKLNAPPLDLSGKSSIPDGNIDQNDNVNTNGLNEIISGKKSDNGMMSQPSIISNVNKEYKYITNTTGTLEKTTESKSTRSGRVSWQQFR